MENFEQIKKEITEKINKLGLTKVSTGEITQQEYKNYPGFYYYVVTIYGGFNGHGNWNIYLHQIEEILEHFPGSYLINLDGDGLDDLWMLKIGVLQ